MTKCRCYSDFDENKMVADCSNSGLTGPPQKIPPSIEWLILSGNEINVLNENAIVLQDLTKLNLSDNMIPQLTSGFVNWLIDGSKLSVLDISNNKLTTLPKNIKNATSYLDELRISGNKFECLCDHIWIRDWLVNSSDIVTDFGDVQCYMKSGEWISLIQMNEEDLGCVFKFPMWTISSKLFITTE